MTTSSTTHTAAELPPTSCQQLRYLWIATGTTDYKTPAIATSAIALHRAVNAFMTEYIPHDTYLTIWLNKSNLLPRYNLALSCK